MPTNKPLGDTLIFLGDIHGEYDKLDRLLGRLEDQYPHLHTIFLGDLVDRGPKSAQVVSRVKRMVDEEIATLLRGNHDQFVIDAHDRGASLSWLNCGGTAFIKSYQRTYGLDSYSDVMEKFKELGHYDLFQQAPLYYEDQYVFASHAPIPKNKYLADHYHNNGWKENRDILIWSYHGDFGVKENDFARGHDDGRLGIAGHIHALNDHIPAPRLYQHYLFLDSGSGCASWGPLSAAVVEKGKVINLLMEY